MRELDRFTRNYIGTLLWSEKDEDGEPLDRTYTVEDIAPESLAIIRADCADFQAANAELISRSLSQEEPARYRDIMPVAHDFCLTRNRHGAGFWDRGLGEVGELLTEAARAYGEQTLYVGDDGLLYVA